MKGNIFNIQRFCTDDGPGIRTTVFFKGCPLKCDWCHNPESRDERPVVFYNVDKCVSCGSCGTSCENSAHVIADGEHRFDRKRCVSCGRCVEACYFGALELCGQSIEAAELAELLMRDVPFFENSGGGVTISGGEPLLQSDFLLELCRHLKSRNIHVCVETSGFCEFDVLHEISKYVDIFLYDIKILDEELHKKYVGVSNTMILNNLKDLYQLGAKIIPRCPIIPEVNMTREHFLALKKLFQTMPDLEKPVFLPYHPLGVDKAKRLGMEQKYANPAFLKKEELSQFLAILDERDKSDP